MGDVEDLVTREQLRLDNARTPEIAEPTSLEISPITGQPIPVAAMRSAAVKSVDVGGALIVPSLVQAHCHLDLTFLGSDHWIGHNDCETNPARIKFDERVRGKVGVPRADSIERVLEAMRDSGTYHVRTHTRIDDTLGLSPFYAVEEILERFRPHMTIQHVAFPQRGVKHEKNMAKMLAECAELPHTVVGGIDPATKDGDVHTQLGIVFGVAASAGRLIDIHLHDRGTLGAWEISLICDYAREFKYEGRVAVSHAFAVADVGPKEQDLLIENISRSGVGIISAAPYDSPPLPLQKLYMSDVPVALATDSIHDTWGPFGSPDLVDQLNYIAQKSGYRSDSGLELIFALATAGGQRVLSGGTASGGDYGANWSKSTATTAQSVGQFIARRLPRKSVAEMVTSTP